MFTFEFKKNVLSQRICFKSSSLALSLFEAISNVIFLIGSFGSLTHNPGNTHSQDAQLIPLVSTDKGRYFDLYGVIFLSLGDNLNEQSSAWCCGRTDSLVSGHRVAWAILQRDIVCF